jgi:hypothetical protein
MEEKSWNKCPAFLRPQTHVAFDDAPELDFRPGVFVDREPSS